jgi:hypothetical protein
MEPYLTNFVALCGESCDSSRKTEGKAAFNFITECDERTTGNKLKRIIGRYLHNLHSGDFNQYHGIMVQAGLSFTGSEKYMVRNWATASYNNFYFIFYQSMLTENERRGIVVMLFIWEASGSCISMAGS